MRTDNNPLTNVLKSAKLDAVGHRWVAALSNYKFDTNGLSRVMEGTTPDKQICNEAMKAMSYAVTVKMPLIECNMLIEPENQIQLISDDRATDLIATPDWSHEQSLDRTIKRVKGLISSRREISKAECQKEA